MQPSSVMAGGFSVLIVGFAVSVAATASAAPTRPRTAAPAPHAAPSSQTARSSRAKVVASDKVEQPPEVVGRLGGTMKLALSASRALKLRPAQPLVHRAPLSTLEASGGVGAGWLATPQLTQRWQLPGLRPDLRSLGEQAFGGGEGRVRLRDCTLVSCADPAEAQPSGATASTASQDRPDKRLFSNLTQAAGVELTTYAGFLLVTAPAELLAHHARVGASMMPDGTGYVALTGKW